MLAKKKKKKTTIRSTKMINFLVEKKSIHRLLQNGHKVRLNSLAVFWNVKERKR